MRAEESLNSLEQTTFFVESRKNVFAIAAFVTKMLCCRQVP